MLVFLAAPLVSLIARTGLEDLAQTAREADVRDALVVTLEAALIATGLAAIGGVPLAYLLARRSFAGKRLVEAIIDLPIVFPHTAAGIALLLVFGRTGVLGRAFAHLGLTFTDTLAGIAVAMLFVSLPFLVDTAREAFALVDPRYEQLARTLGATPGVAFARVALPLAGRGVLAGALLMWARGMSEFGAVVILAYNPEDRAGARVRALRGLRPRGGPAGRAAHRARGVGRLHRGASHAGRRLAVIRAEAVTVAAGDFTLGPFDFEVGEGEYVAVVGRSGAGKSVLLETIAGLRGVASGRVAIDDREVTSLPPERRGVGLVGQEALLFPHLDVAGNIAFGREVRAGRGLGRFLPRSGRSRRGASRRVSWPGLWGSISPWRASRRRSRAASASASPWRERSPCSRGRCCSTSP